MESPEQGPEAKVIVKEVGEKGCWQGVVKAPRKRSQKGSGWKDGNTVMSCKPGGCSRCWQRFLISLYIDLESTELSRQS